MSASNVPLKGVTWFLGPVAMFLITVRGSDPVPTEFPQAMFLARYIC